MLRIFILFLLIQTICALSRVFLFRHCVRTPMPVVPCGYEDLHAYIDYASQSLPDFGAKAMECTPRGTEIITNEGLYLSSSGYIPKNVALNFVVDNVTRDIQTAEALIAGLNRKPDSYQIDGSVFDPQKYLDSCVSIPIEEKVKILKTELRRIEKLGPSDEDYDWLQSVMGSSIAPPLSKIKDYINDDGLACGRGFISALFTESFLLEYGAGVEVAWNSTNFKMTDDLYRCLDTFHTWYWSIYNVLQLEQDRYSNLLFHMYQATQTDATTVFVGHDAGQNGISVLLNALWPSSTYGAGATPPGGAIFIEEQTDGNLHFWMLQPDFITSKGILRTLPIKFNNTQNNVLTKDDFQKRVENVLHMDCVGP